jgi:hypothetical protein
VQPDEEDDGLVGTGLFMGLIGSEATSPEDQRHKHTSGSEEPDRTTSPTINLESEGNGNNGREGRLTSGETETIKSRCNAGTFVELVRVVGDNGVTGPLGKETEGDEYSETIAVAGSAEEV